MQFQITGNVKGWGGTAVADLLRGLTATIENDPRSGMVTVESDAGQLTAVFDPEVNVELLKMEPQPTVFPGPGDGIWVTWRCFAWRMNDDGGDMGPRELFLRKSVMKYCDVDVTGPIRETGIRCIEGVWYWRVEWLEE